jgi:hypothetical protein
MSPSHPVVQFQILITHPGFNAVQLSYPPSDGVESDVRVTFTASVPSASAAPRGALNVPVGFNLIDWRTLNASQVLLDGDIITLSMRADPTSASVDSLRFELNAGPDAHWWKGLYLSSPGPSIDTTTELFTLVGVEFLFGPNFDLTSTLSRQFLLSDLRNSGRAILLEKAKVFGVHTAMYAVDPSDMPLMGGSIVSFNWLNQGNTWP